MVDAHNPDRARSAEQYVGNIRTINADGAAAIRRHGVGFAREMGISAGVLTVYGSTGLSLATEVIGMPKLSNVEIAEDKIRTVLATRRSTRMQSEEMERRGFKREDYAGQLGSLFSGGVAIFEDADRAVFIGAAAFSGGKPEQDEDIVRAAVERIGLFTDIPPVLPQESQG